MSRGLIDFLHPPWLPVVKGTNDSGCCAMAASITIHGSTNGALYSMAPSLSCGVATLPAQAPACQYYTLSPALSPSWLGSAFILGANAAE